MSSHSISTGAVTFRLGSEDAPEKDDDHEQQKSSSGPLKILVLSDFSGRASKGVCEPSTMAKRRAYRIDKDNFDEVFHALNVAIKFSFNEKPIVFEDIDELHPDHLIENLGVFDRFRRLRHQLGKPNGVAQVAKELNVSSTQIHGSTPSSIDKQDALPSSGGMSLLDDVLSGSKDAQAASLDNEFNIQAIIREAVAPYRIEQEDPRVETLNTMLDAAMTDTLRGILHLKTFQQIESAWQSVDLLNRRLDTDRTCNLSIMDVSWQELKADANNAGDDYKDLALYQRLVTELSVPGEQFFDVIVADFHIQAQVEDLQVLSALACVAKSVQSQLLTNGDPALAGCDDLTASVDLSDWQDTRTDDFKAAWKELRGCTFASNLTLVAPGYLQRLPYGSRTSPIDTFKFEELPIDGAHRYYLWGGGATLLAYLMAVEFAQTGSKGVLGKQRTIDSLPLHVYSLDGETELKPCAEVLITDTAAQRFTDAGMTVLRSVQGKDAILVQTHQSASLE